ncbi:amp-dependent synthetase and ligase, partial [Lasius niger]
MARVVDNIISATGVGYVERKQVDTAFLILTDDIDDVVVLRDITQPVPTKLGLGKRLEFVTSEPDAFVAVGSSAETQSSEEKEMEGYESISEGEEGYDDLMFANDNDADFMTDGILSNYRPTKA